MRFGGLIAIDDLSFSANQGEITAIIGPNGAGKTTVFNCITGFYKPTGGRLGPEPRWRIRPADVTALTASGRRSRKTAAGAVFLLERMPDHEIAARARVARTFQNIRLFPGMTVLENLIVAQHNALMAGLGLDGAGPVRRQALRAGRGGRPSSAPSPGSRRCRSSTAPTIRPATCPTARSGGSRSRAPCAPSRLCCASTSRRRASTRASPRTSPRSSSPSRPSTARRSC